MNQLMLALIVGFVGAVIVWIAARLHYFHFKSLPDDPLPIRGPIWGFLGYLIVYFFIAPFVVSFMGSGLRTLLQNHGALFITLLQLISVCLTVTYLILYSLYQWEGVVAGIWLHPSRRRLVPVLEDLGLGMLSWIIVFPLGVAAQQLLEFFTTLITSRPPTQQVAIQFLLMVKSSPPLLIIALFCILIAAPIIEEYVFRGILYNTLKSKMGKRAGIILTSLIFSLFHFSLAQGISNLSILFSLFIFALFLNFLYERQRSLIAPIALHMTFNSISVIRIILISN